MVLQTERRNIPISNGMRLKPIPKLMTVVEPPDPSPEELARLKREFQCLFPVNPHMRNIEDRFTTFDHRWPKHKINATIQHIVKAGFFFLGW